MYQNANFVISRIDDHSSSVSTTKFGHKLYKDTKGIHCLFDSKSAQSALIPGFIQYFFIFSKRCDRRPDSVSLNVYRSGCKVQYLLGFGNSKNIWFYIKNLFEFSISFSLSALWVICIRFYPFLSIGQLGIMYLFRSFNYRVTCISFYSLAHWVACIIVYPEVPDLQ